MQDVSVNFHVKAWRSIRAHSNQPQESFAAPGMTESVCVMDEESLNIDRYLLVRWVVSSQFIKDWIESSAVYIETRYVYGMNEVKIQVLSPSHEKVF